METPTTGSEYTNTTSEVVVITDLAQLEATLIQHGIDISKWGQGKAKTVGELFNEVRQNESELRVNNGVLERHLWPVGMNVRYQDNGKRLLLRERAQIFLKDGKEDLTRIKKRGLDAMPTSLGGKAMRGEDPVEAGMREFVEELGVPPEVEVKVSNVSKLNPKRKHSDTFPGLLCVYNETHLDIEMPLTAYAANGTVKNEQVPDAAYVEHQPNRKNTYFGWDKEKE